MGDNCTGFLQARWPSCHPTTSVKAVLLWTYIIWERPKLCVSRFYKYYSYYELWLTCIMAIKSGVCNLFVTLLTQIIQHNAHSTEWWHFLKCLNHLHNNKKVVNLTDTHTHTRLTALCPGLPGWASTRKVKPIWILLKQETVSGIGIRWVICKSASRSRQITTPAPHHSVFYRLDALPAAQPTVSKHWIWLNRNENLRCILGDRASISTTFLAVVDELMLTFASAPVLSIFTVISALFCNQQIVFIDYNLHAKIKKNHTNLLSRAAR